MGDKMIEDSVLDNVKITQIMNEEYEIDIYVIEKLTRGSANIYLLNNDEYILKEFQSKYTIKDIEKETKVINHLRKDHLKVPEYMVTKDGKYYTEYLNKIIIVQKYIKGNTIKQNSGTYEQLMESAIELGKIINSLETLEIDLPYNDYSLWFTNDKLNKSIQNYENLLKDVPSDKYYLIICNDLNNKINMLKDLKNNYDVNEIKDLTIKNTHGDYSVQQFIYDNDKIKAIIDFAASCKMPIVWEVIRSYSYMDECAINGEFNLHNFIDYVKVFNRYVPLNHNDLKYMPYLYLIQLLSSNYGYKQYIYDNKKEELLIFGFFRTKLCRYLFNNAEMISQKLLNEITE